MSSSEPGNLDRALKELEDAFEAASQSYESAREELINACDSLLLSEEAHVTVLATRDLCVPFKETTWMIRLCQSATNYATAREALLDRRLPEFERQHIVAVLEGSYSGSWITTVAEVSPQAIGEVESDNAAVVNHVLVNEVRQLANEPSQDGRTMNLLSLLIGLQESFSHQDSRQVSDSTAFQCGLRVMDLNMPPVAQTLLYSSPEGTTEDSASISILSRRNLDTDGTEVDLSDIPPDQIDPNLEIEVTLPGEKMGFPEIDLLKYRIHVYPNGHSKITLTSCDESTVIYPKYDEHSDGLSEDAIHMEFVAAFLEGYINGAEADGETSQ